MRHVDENALICDLAETYQIYDYTRLPLSSVAAFAVGLREDSRIKMKLNGIHNIPPKILIDVIAVDTQRAILWALAGAKKEERPESLAAIMMGESKKEKMQGFSTAEEFEAARQRIIDNG